MIIESLALGSVIALFHRVDKATKIDEKAIKKYTKAFVEKEEATLLLTNKAELTDKRLENVVRKKRAIINTTIPKFVEVYSQIQKVEVLLQDKKFELAIKEKNQELASLHYMSITHKEEFTDKELVCGILVKGIGKMIEKDSERFLSAANNQLRSANVMCSQAESISAFYDAIIERADRIAKLLSGMNALFLMSIQETKNTIERNGVCVREYSEYDKGVLMTCVNIAKAMADIINVPVVDEDGVICQSAIEMIENGEKYVTKVNNIIMR